MTAPILLTAAQRLLQALALTRSGTLQVAHDASVDALVDLGLANYTGVGGWLRITTHGSVEARKIGLVKTPKPTKAREIIRGYLTDRPQSVHQIAKAACVTPRRARQILGEIGAVRVPAIGWRR